MHPGYATFDDPDRMRGGVLKMRRQLTRLGIHQDALGGRQHYLRWKTPTTAQALEAAEIDYDSTLGFADHAGFRCGVCYEFSMYDIVERKPLKLKQRPLIAMDCSIIDERYMGLGAGAVAFDCLQKLKSTCQSYRGDFVILWHNTRFLDGDEMSLYRRILEEA
jgi:hypothetical protein